MIAAGLLLLALASAGQADGKDATTAPVREGYCVVLPDEPIDPTITAEWSGRTIAFCCKMCRKQFLADPGAFAALLPPEPEPEPAAVATPPVPPEEANRAKSWGAWLGRLHPPLVHFPVALLVLAGLCELLASPRPGEPWRARTRFLLALGAPLALLAAGLGWLAARESAYPTLADVLERHRWLGVATAATALFALVAAPRARGSGGQELVFRLLLLAAVVLVALAGHHGATLVFGPGWLGPPR